MQNEDLIRIHHIYEAAEEIVGYVSKTRREDLDTNRMLLHSLVRCIEIIGEAASKVSKETQSSLSAIPWADIVAMRNRIVHAYFDINKSIVWNTATQHIPPLLLELRKIPGVRE
jgi:uncharacterized protein with HEPN domain